MKKRLRFLLAMTAWLGFLSGAIGSPLSIYNVRDSGALGDGIAMDTKAIQSAVDACASNGGGTVFFPAGKYLSGTIFMKSHVTLELQTGAVLLGSVNLEDYPLTLCRFVSYTDLYCGRALIWGEDLEDIGIIGQGLIDGQGAAFKDNRPPQEEADKISAAWTDPARYKPAGGYINRPYILRLVSCRNVRIEDVSMLNSAMWMQHYLNCEYVRIRGISVYNHCSANNDMIDIDSCREVIISDCFGDSDDDALTLKSTSNLPTENVVITNCALSSHCNAIKMGTESHGGFKNISISNCVIRPSRDRDHMAGRNDGHAAIALEMVDGGMMDRIAITNIAIHGQTTPIFARLGNRARIYRKDLPKPEMGSMRNIILSDIVATDAREQGCSITGLPGFPIENMTLSNIRLVSEGGGSAPETLDVPENPDKYPECAMFGPLPVYGFYVRHVRNLVMKDMDISCSGSDPRAAMLFEDASGLALENLQAQASPESPAQIIFRDVRDVLFTGCHPLPGRVFVDLLGQCSGISALSNDFRRVAVPFQAEGQDLSGILAETGNLMPSK